MALIAAFGAGLFVLASLIVGGRLLWLAKRTRGLPEFTLGAGLFFIGGVGYPLLVIAVHAKDLSDTARAAMLVANMVTTTGGMSGLALFTRRVFRPHELWAGLLSVGVALAYLGIALGQAFGPGLMAHLADPDHGSWSMTLYFGLVVLGWTGFESIHQYRMQRKRLALGLADPVVTDRFRLWGVSILAACCINLISSALRLMGYSIAGSSVGNMLVGSLGLVAAIHLWLAFVPPQSYLERVSGRAQGDSA